MLGADVDCEDSCPGKEVRELNRVLAEPAGADGDEHQATLEEGPGALHGGVGRDGGAAERRRLERIERP